jgi:hypothetical protein
VGFDVNRSTTVQKFCIRQVLEKKWEYSETVYQLFIDIKKTYDSVRREGLYNILTVSSTRETTRIFKDFTHFYILEEN